jgi:hypothetical protein
MRFTVSSATSDAEKKAESKIRRKITNKFQPDAVIKLLVTPV